MLLLTHHRLQSLSGIHGLKVILVVLAVQEVLVVRLDQAVHLHPEHQIPGPSFVRQSSGQHHEEDQLLVDLAVAVDD